jgi:hypothetical protein
LLDAAEAGTSTVTVNKFYKKPIKEFFPKIVKTEPKRKQARNTKPPSLELTSQKTLDFIYANHLKQKEKERAKQEKLEKEKQAKAAAKAATKAEAKAEANRPSTSGETSKKKIVEPAKKAGRPSGSSKRKSSATPRKLTRSAGTVCDKNQKCCICLHYKGDPDDPLSGSDDWFSCPRCQADYHEICKLACKRCTCGLALKSD